MYEECVHKMYAELSRKQISALRTKIILKNMKFMPFQADGGKDRVGVALREKL